MSVHFYPVTKNTQDTECCEDYIVKINGEQVALDTARVSAMPFNRRWPGHQRSKDQTELINFLSFAMDEPVTVEIFPKEPFENAVIRPQTLGIEPQICEGILRFTLDKPACFTVEPYGRHHALHIFADAMPQYSIDFSDKNLIYFGAGEHDVGLLELQSNQTVFIDEGAVVYACIHAIDAENIKLLGRGILDNSRNKEEILFECSAEHNDSAVNNAKRRHTVQLEYCNNIEIDGITIRDSLVYNIRPIGCKNLHINAVKIIGCWRYNSDGIDMHNCENVLIENCFLRTFDDSVCIKGFDCYDQGDVEKAVYAAMHHGGKLYDVFKNAVVKNCVIWNDWGKCLEIGAETRAEEICDISFQNCNIIHVMFSPLDCYNVDYADVHGVEYRDISVEYDETIPAAMLQETDDQKYVNQNPDYAPSLILVSSDYHHEYSAGGSRRGINREMLFKNIHFYGRHKPSFYFKGYDEEHKTKDIRLENIFWNGALLADLSDCEWKEEAFTENITYAVTSEENTVSAEHQLNPSEYIQYYQKENPGKRILFAGNSITLHGVKHEIGWHNRWGMAASAKEKDYVHLLMSKINQTEKNAAYCVCQVAAWEWQYQNGEKTYPLFESAREFDADIIIVRFIENCSAKNFDAEAFYQEAKAFLRYLSPSGRAKFVFTTGFWHHPGDAVYARIAKEWGCPLVPLGDLGENPEMKALGLFEHQGVASHPGDLGMKTIADRIYPVVRSLF